jgi:hypothetical protein
MIGLDYSAHLTHVLHVHDVAHGVPRVDDRHRANVRAPPARRRERALHLGHRERPRVVLVEVVLDERAAVERLVGDRSQPSHTSISSREVREWKRKSRGVSESREKESTSEVATRTDDVRWRRSRAGTAGWGTARRRTGRG